MSNNEKYLFVFRENRGFEIHVLSVEGEGIGIIFIFVILLLLIKLIWSIHESNRSTGDSAEYNTVRQNNTFRGPDCYQCEREI